MSFFSEDRMAELRELFFESAQELMQALNDQALELEKSPDPEVMRGIRRTVHTLKGDSAAVGYGELSQLAHELEEVLTPERVTSPAVADVVLAAADVFHAILQACRGNLQPPPVEDLRRQIHALVQVQVQSAPGVPAEAAAARFQWSEYEQVLIVEGARGTPVYNIAALLDPACAMRAAAVQLIKNALRGCGNVLVLRPDDEAPVENLDCLEAAIATERDPAWLEKKLCVPPLVRQVTIEPYRLPGRPSDPDAEAPGAAVAEELAAVPVPGAEKTRTAIAARSSAARDSLLRVDAGRIDAVLNLVGELIIGKSMLLQSIAEFGRRAGKDPLHTRLSDAMAYQARVMADLQKAVMKIRMVPVEQLFRRFPRVVRDVAHSSGKQVSLTIVGEQTDLDKSVLDQLAEPLTHLVRNAVDHGIELPDARVAAGKPAEGTVRLNAYHQGHQVVIEISDDGRGIDRQTLLARALERGFVSVPEAGRLSDADVLDLMFRPGFSTAAQVTQISGRGVGLDVVRNTTERLKGSVTVHSTPGAGATFLLKVPLTLAIIKALLFRAADRLFAVPLSSVVEITRADVSEFHHLEDTEILTLRGQFLPVVRLQRNSGAAKVFVVVIAMPDRQFGLMVDQLVGEEELVIKALDDPLVASDLVSGASILGDGTVVLVLNVPALSGRVGLAPVGALA